MDERSTLNHWLRSLTGKDDAAFGVDRTYRLHLGEKLAMTLFVPDDGSRLMIMADLLRVDDVSPEIFREAAAINLRFDLTGGMTVALEKSSSTLIAFYQHALGSLDLESFRGLLAALEPRLPTLRKPFEALAQDLNPLATPRPGNPACGAFA